MMQLLLMATLAAHPNLFEPKEMSSEDIFASVALCMDKTLRTVPGTSETVAIATCGCLLDAQRANARKGKKDTSATTEQMARCHKLGKERGTKSGKAKGETGT